MIDTKKEYFQKVSLGCAEGCIWVIPFFHHTNLSQGRSLLGFYDVVSDMLHAAYGTPATGSYGIF